MTTTDMQMTNEPVWQSVAQRAYAIWESEGRPHGRDFDHWLQAEAELVPPAPVKKPTKRATAKPRTARTRKRAT